MLQARNRHRVIRWLLTGQLLLTLLIGTLGLIGGVVVAKSALLGGLICWLPNCYFAYRAFRYRGARAARKIMRAFYAGAAGKMVLTFGLFTIVFVKVTPLSAPALFAGFVGVQTLNWIVPLLVDRLERSRQAPDPSGR